MKEKLQLLYEERPTTTEMVEYGTRFADVIAGTPPGPEGARFDLHFVAHDMKSRISGNSKGVTSLTARADGISLVEIYETFVTEDEENILIKGSGFAFPGVEPGALTFKGTYRFHTSSPKYAWLNSTIGVGEGGGNPVKGDVAIRVYLWE